MPAGGFLPGLGHFLPGAAAVAQVGVAEVAVFHDPGGAGVGGIVVVTLKKITVGGDEQVVGIAHVVRGGGEPGAVGVHAQGEAAHVGVAVGAGLADALAVSIVGAGDDVAAVTGADVRTAVAVGKMPLPAGRAHHRVQGVITLNERTRGWPLIKEVLNYTFRGKGMLTMGAGTAALFAKSRDGLEQADMQLIFAPGSFAAPGVLETLPGMTIGCWPSRPQSRGTVLAVSTDPMQQPAIHLNYLSAQEDERLVIAGTRLIRKLFAAPALARWSAGETFPGPQLETDTEILDFARERASSGLHFAGTCRMGGEDAVLDPKLRVRGVSALRVVDASAMPGTTIGNTNATVVMVAEKAAAMILESIAA